MYLFFEPMKTEFDDDNNNNNYDDDPNDDRTLW